MPIFENDKHRNAQDRLQWILEHMGFRVEQTSTLCAYDLRLYRGAREHAILEFKERDKLWDPLKVDQHKIVQLVSAARERGSKPIFMIGGPPYYWVHPHLNYPTSQFLRTKDGKARGETPDTVFEIPASDFKLL